MLKPRENFLPEIRLARTSLERAREDARRARLTSGRSLARLLKRPPGRATARGDCSPPAARPPRERLRPANCWPRRLWFVILCASGVARVHIKVAAFC